MRTILAGIVGVFAAIIGVVIVFVVNSEDRNAIATAAPTPEVIAERQAPATRNNPMQPVTEEEAARRAELHARMADPAAQLSSAVMAPAVVTDVVAANSNDELSIELFGDALAATPEPQRELPRAASIATLIGNAQDHFDAFVAALPEPEEPVEEVAEVVVVAEPEPVIAEPPALNPYNFMDRYRIDTARPGNDFGVRNIEGGFEGPYDDGAFLDRDLIRQLIGDDYLQIAGFQDEEEGWFEPFQVADEI